MFWKDKMTWMDLMLLSGSKYVRIYVSVSVGKSIIHLISIWSSLDERNRLNKGNYFIAFYFYQSAFYKSSFLQVRVLLVHVLQVLVLQVQSSPRNTVCPAKQVSEA